MGDLQKYLPGILIQLLMVMVLWAGSAAAQRQPVLTIHYLGHSSFILQFDNGVTVVTDYGKENAWLDWGWDSPVNSLNDFVPDIMTYSHTHHEDHYAPERAPAGVPHILTGNDELTFNDVTITPIRVCEENINDANNTAFLFSYKGYKILHLGDAQADIQSISDPAVRDRILNGIPQSLDLLFMTIEGTAKFIDKAEEFVNLLQPKRIIPMHYWSTQYKLDFISHCESKNGAEKNYQKEMISGAKYLFCNDEEAVPIKIISLAAGEYSSGEIPADNKSHPLKK